MGGAHAGLDHHPARHAGGHHVGGTRDQRGRRDHGQRNPPARPDGIGPPLDPGRRAARPAQGTHRAFLWSEATGLRDLGTLGGASAAANDLNASGWVVGTSDTAEARTQAFLWRDGAMRSLGTLGGRASAASAINAAGLVGGNSETSTGVQHAFVWSEELGMADLNDRVRGASPGVLQVVLAVADNGAVLAMAEGGTLVLLQPA